MKGLIIRIFACGVALTTVCAAAESEDPFSDGSDDPPPSESLPRPITDDGRRTLKVLESVKIPLIRLTADTRYDAYKILKEELAKHGVIVRLKDYGETKMEPSGQLVLRDIAVSELLKYLRDWAWWGWILYPDGSVTLFDNQCACTYPKHGLYCHDEQYEAGSPEVMAKAQEEAKNNVEQGGSVGPAARPESDSEGGDQPPPESEGRSR